MLFFTVAPLWGQGASPFTAVQSQLDKILAQLGALQTAVNALQPPAPPPSTTTNLLFTFINTDPGFDTGIAISNTGNVPGNCTLHFFGRGLGATSTATLPAVGNIVPGTWEAVQISTIVSGFEGFIRASCSFPNARGYALFSDTGIRNFATSYLAEIQP